jgi:hypothetical protein
MRNWLVDWLLCVACYCALLDDRLAAVRGYMLCVAGWLPAVRGLLVDLRG